LGSLYSRRLVPRPVYPLPLSPGEMKRGEVSRAALEDRLATGAPTQEKMVEAPVTPGFKVKSNDHSKCAQESSLHTYRAKNGYRITNVSIYNIYYTNNVLQKTESNSIDKI
jgi:hypothetical protein